MHGAMVAGKGTRDLCGPEGLTTEAFVAEITARIDAGEASAAVAKIPVVKADKTLRRNYQVDIEAVAAWFDKYDTDRDNSINLDEFTKLLVDLDVAPKMTMEEKASKDDDQA